MNLAVIPARGGSKRIPRKNIKEFCGKPMIAWSIEHARSSRLFDHIIVSTDDAEIAEVARRWGAEIPFLRPASLSDDHTPTVPVIAHAVRATLELKWSVDYACCIYPCSPFLHSTDLAAAHDMALALNADFVFPVAEYAHPIQRAMRRLATGKMQFLQPEHEMTRTQDLEKTYHDAGQFYWGKGSAWLAGRRMHSDGIGMPIPNWRVVDIDSHDDWLRAENLFRVLEP
jgi:pseudaminic acid cytidylyltransferase